MDKYLLLMSVALLALLASKSSAKITDEAQAEQFLNGLDPEYLRAANKGMKVRWTYITNVTQANSDALVESNTEFLAYQQSAWEKVNEYDWSNFQNPTTKREFEFLNIIGPGALSPEDANTYNQLAANMETVYSTAKICPMAEPNCATPSIPLEPDLMEIMATSENYDELQYAWVEWHKAAGAPIRSDYMKFVELNNKAAFANNYPNMGSLWNAYYLYEGYSEDDFKAAIENLWQTVKPLYEQLYTYVRRVLSETVYKGQVQRFGRLPAHVLGNMWAQEWGNVAKSVLPYPNAPAVDATPAMQNQSYDAKKMFELAQEFFRNLGFDNMTDTFWAESMIDKPTDGREVVCHASAEEFFFGPGNNTDIREDFRIKMCTAVTQEDFVTVHHEMGHIQYFMKYKDQHYIFRNGANPGFHEAIGDTIALAVSTPTHLTGLGLLSPNESPNATETEPLLPGLPARPEGFTEQELNYMMKQALDKVAFIPFGYLMDKWRWSVFALETTEANLNAKWWELREELQGLKPPVPRTEDDFDPGAKYHIPANVEYIRYFVSYIIQFQFYEALCREAGQYDPNNPSSQPLYKCDFGNNTQAGEKLMKMMEPGFSKPWPDSLEFLTGTREMSATSLMKYFDPLYKWLQEANSLSRECLGWDTNCEEYAAEYMAGEYENSTSVSWNQASIAEWNFETDVNDANEALSTAASLAAAAYHKEAWENYLTQFEYEEFSDESLKRQFKLLQTLGTPALSEEDQENLTTTINKMIGRYSDAWICPYNDQNCDGSDKWYLEPEITEVLATSKDYDELSYVWSEWRRVASTPMRPDYLTYVELENKAAVANKKPDMSEIWVEPYELGDRKAFQTKMEGILTETKPLYDKLHAYTRLKLRERYGSEKMGAKGDGVNVTRPIPASVLGNMWSQTWENLYDLLAPYPEAGTVDVTDEMLKQKWNATYMFQVAEEFYTSIGLQAMPTCYGENSLIEKPDDRTVVCHASAWDFSDKKDFRIKMCTVVNMDDLITIHHEQGHIQYYQQYKNQPATFRDGANPGFHEAIGDVMALSVSTPGHMSKIGLIPNFAPSDRSDYNFLMRKALEKIVFLPFAYVMDRWRYGVFSGEYPPEKWMYHWLELSEKYQGIVPPVNRSNDDFDPGAKYHTAADVEYSRYFVAAVLQFQIHKALCIKAGKYIPGNPQFPLYRCDIYQSQEAGAVMEKLLSAGSSKPWPDILEEAIGERDMNASAILEFFQPIEQYLDFWLDRYNESTGWSSVFESYIATTDDVNNDTNSVDNTVPIIVGSVLGAMVIIVIIAYFVGRSRHRKKHGHDNPALST